MHETNNYNLLVNQTNDNLSWIDSLVTQALSEDVGTGDITANLISQDTQISAQLITREPAVICGIPVANEIFKRVDNASINYCWI